MINQKFSDIFPFAYNYFSTLFELINKRERKFPQAIIFEGIDTQKQYLFALELARILNCKQSKNSSCSCINCSWAKNLSHPAIQNVSQIHFKGEDDETKTVISTKQAREIEKNLLLSSDYYRFFIFFSSKEKEYESGELFNFKAFGYSDEIDYSIEPLAHSTFHNATLNALLKSVEEPPENTTFVFLVKSKEDILPTIVSRCLVFKLSSGKNELNYNSILNIIAKYPNIQNQDVYEMLENIENYLVQNQITLEEFLNMFLVYLKDLLLNNSLNSDLAQKIGNDIKIINQAIKHSRANIQNKHVIECMLLRLARGF